MMASINTSDLLSTNLTWLNTTTGNFDGYYDGHYEDALRRAYAAWPTFQPSAPVKKVVSPAPVKKVVSFIQSLRDEVDNWLKLRT
jgi:hypothetical protein